MPSASGNGSGSGPRYAPEDPTLPKPWKGLVDGSTGYLYYWNPETNVTQYEKPVKEKLPGPPPLPPPPAGKPASVSSSVHRGEPHDEEGRGRSHQHQGGRGSYSHTAGDAARGHGSRTSARAHAASDAVDGLSVEAYRRQHEITINGDDVPPPYMSFESAGFPSEILKEVQRAGFAAPTPIQAQSWPIALQNRDVVAIAKTGSGKTLGYLIPGFVHLKRLCNNPKMGPTVLILAPTRELATQIQDEADKFGRSSKISCTCVYGGAPKGPQLRALDRGVDVVVATPGRLNDVLEMRRVNLRQVSYLVLDEADRMLDMGFEPQIRKIVKEIPNRRQTLMFTATWPKEVRRIAADLLDHPLQVNIGNIDELVANKAITQYVEVLKPNEKQRRLEQILRSEEPGSKVIIFCSTKRMCDQLAKTLTRQFRAAAIHGDKNQGERDRVLGQFRTGKCPILVATDVAARGLDIKDIRVVINYDFPTGVEDYVHRIGRTGRAGATGVSYTFFGDQDRKYALDLVKVLEGAGQRVPPELQGMASRGGFGGRSRRWGSGRANGMGHADPVYSARGARGLPPSGRSDVDRAAHRVDRDSRDRLPRDHGHQDKHELEPRAREEPRVREDIKTTKRGRARSRSSSPSPKKPRLERSRSQSWSRSRSRSPILVKKSRSRSRSRSTDPVLDRHGRPLTRRRESPVFKRREPVANVRRPDRSRSPLKRKSSSASYDDGEIRDDRVDRSLSSRKGRSRSPFCSRDGRSPSPWKERSLSPPIRAQDDRVHRSPVRSKDGQLHRTPSQERPRSPARGQEDRLRRSPVRARDDRLRRSSSPRKERSRSPVRGPEDRRLRRSPVRMRNDRLRRSPSPLKERSRSPVRVKDDQLHRAREDRPHRSLSPRKRPRSPYTSNGRLGGFASPNGTEAPPNHVGSHMSAYDGEMEEGMIVPDEEEGMIHPNEDIGEEPSPID